jgi:hypothetical protein
MSKRARIDARALVLACCRIKKEEKDCQGGNNGRGFGRVHLGHTLELVISLRKAGAEGQLELIGRVPVLTTECMRHRSECIDVWLAGW